MRRLVALALWVGALAVCGGCVVRGLEATATTGRWPVDAESAFGCTPVMVEVFGSGVRSSGSGVLIAPRWLLTAGHVVPEGAQVAVVSRLDRPHAASGVGTPVEVIISGGGRAVRAGDWALLRLGAAVEHLGATPAPLWPAGLPTPEPATVVGFPLVVPASGDGDGTGKPASDVAGDGAEDGERAGAIGRAALVLRTERSRARVLGRSRDEGALRFYRAPASGALGGASGGPVLAADASGRPVLVGVLLGRLEHRGLLRRGRALVAHAIPPEAYLAAAGVLEGGVGPAAGLWGPATLPVDGDGLPQRRAAGR